ncbi:MAG: formylglycine-generating enzyme family protein [Cyanobacteriota bacterium]|nr:formylglycine-generating enzyme family protein [Cyanobacteriota bacterium]
MASPAAPPSLQLLRWRSRAQVFHERIAGLDLPMLRIPAGRFLMGSPLEEEGRSDDEGTPREMALHEFLISRTPITVAQWRAVALWEPGLEAAGAGSDANADAHPITGVSHADASEFCRRLSGRTGRNYRLPSEAQWDYAWRAGTTTAFHTGATISSELANYNGSVAYGPGPLGEFRQNTTAVAQFPANAWGVHDMHGNVWEWCEAPADSAARSVLCVDPPKRSRGRPCSG